MDAKPVSDPVGDLEANGLDVLAAMRAAIAAHSIRQYQVAEKIGVTEGHLSMLLLGRKRMSDELAGKIRVAITELAA